MEKWLVQTRMGGCRESVDDSNPSCAVQPRHGRGTVVEEAEAAAAGWWFGSGSSGGSNGGGGDAVPGGGME